MRRFCVFEGIDGVGKSSLLQLFEERYPASIIATREPMDRNLAETYRGASPEEMCYYFAIDRFRHLKELEREIMDDDRLIICDRYVYSNYAYQMYHGCAIDFIDRLQPPNIIWPDCVIHFNCDPEIAAERSGETNIERLRVIQGLYKTVYALKTDSPVYCIDTSNMDLELVFDEVKCILEHLELL